MVTAAVAIVSMKVSMVGCCRVEPAPLGGPAGAEIDGYPAVNAADYKTYRSYGWSAAQFVTEGGVRCRIYDGPSSFQYSADVECWGDLPGVEVGVNVVEVSIYGKVWAAEGRNPTPADGPTVFSFFNHANDLSGYDTYLEGFQTKKVDPASYHLLPAGHKIVVRGGRDGGDADDAVCGAGTGDLLICELRNIGGHGETHGFRLSPRRSYVY